MERGALGGRRGNDGGGRAQVSTGTYTGGTSRQCKGDWLLWCQQFELSGRPFGRSAFSAPEMASSYRVSECVT